MDEFKKLKNYRYEDMLKIPIKSAEVKEQIEKDIHRTFPEHYLFVNNGEGQRNLLNILTALANTYKTMGYC